MAFEPGGYADKLGNRYEGRWVVWQMFHVLKEDIRSITLEAIGDDERGVDLWIERNDGYRQAQQCKAENASRQDWSMADLNRRGILEFLRFQLERNETYEYLFVSGTQATMLRDLTRSARDSTENPEEFFQYQVQKVSEARRTAFRQFCEYLGIDHTNPEDRRKAHNLLKRADFHFFEDSLTTLENLKTWVGMWVTGSPTAIIASLAEYAQNNLRKTIYSDDILTHLANLGFQPRQLAHDKRVAPAIEKLYYQFEKSIRPGLIAGELIPREETDAILKALSSEDPCGIVVLHGTAGYGKSGVLYDLTQRLQKEGIPFLPVRLDRQVPRNNTNQFGDDMGLPDSPVTCLDALAGDRQSVLILDQLDALRWTSVHSTNALDVCKCLMREVVTLRHCGKRISCVLSCRTFDLEHDPRIKEWLKESGQGKHLEIRVVGLSEEIVKSVVEAQKVSYSQVSARQKSLLKSPQNLAMWVTLRQSEVGQVPEFHTASELMRQFWQNRYRELEKEGVSNEEFGHAIQELVDYMETRRQLWAPQHLLESSPKLSDLFHSLGIIQTSNRQIAFCHQSYFDFQVADRVLQHITTGVGSVRGWLEEKENQSLFRREQLRLVLALLIDESRSEFEIAVHELLEDSKIRFHLRHLVLSILGQIEQPWQSLFDLAAELIQNEYWHDHALRLIYWKHPPYIHSLVERKIIQGWLEEAGRRNINDALRLLKSINEISADLVAELLERCICRDGEWPMQVLWTLCFDPHKDSDRMFELRLKLARMGYVSDYVRWPDLVNEYPKRAIQLIEAVVTTWDISNRPADGLRPRRNSRFEQWNPEDMKALRRGARQESVLAWDMLIPHIERITSIRADPYDRTLNEWQDGKLYAIENGYTAIPRGIVEVVCEAGKELARNRPEELLARAHCLHASISSITQQILMETYAALPGTYADEAIKWLLADTRRLSIGSGHREPVWMPAVRLLKELSPHCSDGLFRELEETLLCYHSPSEKREAKYWLQSSRKSYYGAWFGEAQYFLLPALDAGRRSATAEDLIRVLERKFSYYSKSGFLRSSTISGGLVGSPLPSKTLHQISDRAWLAIINNKRIPDKDHFRRKQIGPDQVSESSITHFSHDLRTVAGRYPERFARLALQFPDDVHPWYLAAILDGVKTTEPKQVPDEEKAAWAPAKIETIEAIFEKFSLGDEQRLASDFCWLIKNRSQENWSERAINRLLKYAKSHPDPNPGKLNLYPSSDGNDVNSASVDTIEGNALNCVRGIAGLAIGALLWQHPGWLERLQAGIEGLIHDPHPAVKVSAIEACLPILRIDKDFAVKLFIIACQGDLRIAATRAAKYFFNCGIKSHFGQLSPIICQMLSSNRDDVAEEGAAEVCARWLFHGMFESELAECRKGSVAQRKGVAKVAAYFLADEEYADRCHDLLSPLFNDREAEVRQETRNVFRRKEGLKVSNMPTFALEYVKSKAFLDHPTELLLALKDYPDSLLRYAEVLFKVCEVFAGPLVESSRNLAKSVAHDVSLFSALMLRLYEQSQDVGRPDIQNRCLDTWDMMFENEVGMTHDLMTDIEQEI